MLLDKETKSIFLIKVYLYDNRKLPAMSTCIFKCQCVELLFSTNFSCIYIDWYLLQF